MNPSRSAFACFLACGLTCSNILRDLDCRPRTVCSLDGPRTITTITLGMKHEARAVKGKGEREEEDARARSLILIRF